MTPNTRTATFDDREAMVAFVTQLAVPLSEVHIVVTRVRATSYRTGGVGATGRDPFHGGAGGVSVVGPVFADDDDDDDGGGGGGGGGGVVVGSAPPEPEVRDQFLVMWRER